TNLIMQSALTDNAMNFHDFHLETSDSDIEGTIHFSFDGTMADFENRVQVDADFEDSRVSTSDLHKLYDKFAPGHHIIMQGKMTGVLNDLDLRNFYLAGMDATALDGNINLKNIFEDHGFRVKGDFKNLTTNYSDLVRLLPGLLQNRLPKNLKKLGTIHLSGGLSATSSSVQTNSAIRSKIGNAKLDAGL